VTLHLDGRAFFLALLVYCWVLTLNRLLLLTDVHSIVIVIVVVVVVIVVSIMVKCR